MSGQSPDHLGSAIDGHEQPGLVADDLGEAALRLVPGEARGFVAGKLETLAAVDQRALENEFLDCAQWKRLARAQHHRGKLVRRHVERNVQPELRSQVGKRGCRDLSAEQRPSVVGCDPDHLHMIVGKLVPHRQQKAGGKV